MKVERRSKPSTPPTIVNKTPEKEAETCLFAPRTAPPTQFKPTIGCATIGFYIHSDGSTGNHKVLTAHNADIFLNSWLNIIQTFTYIPSEKNPKKVEVLTLQTFTYQMDSNSTHDAENKRKKMSETCASEAMELLGKSASES